MPADDSITGLMDSMLREDEDRPHTPEHGHEHGGGVVLPPDADTEDGVPYGRSHHHERATATLLVEHPLPSIPPQESLPTTTTTTNTTMNTPVRPDSPRTPTNHHSHGEIPLGRSARTERLKARHLEELPEQEIEEDVGMMPLSPSPAKPPSSTRKMHANEEELVPRFELENLLRDAPKLEGMFVVMFLCTACRGVENANSNNSATLRMLTRPTVRWRTRRVRRSDSRTPSSAVPASASESNTSLDDSCARGG